MKSYKIKITPNAKEDLRKYIAYLVNVKKNPQAARNVMDDYKQTKESLKITADAIKNPDSDILKARKLKRINFLQHDYFMLFRIDEDTVTVTNIFHSREDFENKLA